MYTLSCKRSQSNQASVVTITATGTVLVDDIENKLPIFTVMEEEDQVKIFKPSTFFIIVQTPSLKIVIQLVTVMQVYLEASSQQKGTLSGLCGNFNDIQEDDFKTESGLIEGTATTFASTWKTMLCQDSGPSLYDPCSMSVEKENYAKEWCEKLSNPAGVFSPCHLELNPKDYVARCKYDACICDQSEECMCAAVSSYVYACAVRGIMLKSWRDNICNTYTKNCPGNMEYSYNQTSCRKTCRSLSENDRTCNLSYTPLDGCGCAKNTYLNDMNECVPASDCPCYVDREVVAPMQVISMAGSTCTCRDGTMHCIGHQEITTCTAPLVYFNCLNAEPGQKGTECQNSCQTPDSNQCTSTQCKSGCVCPEGLLADGQGGCVQEENCPCVHNGVFYQPGETVKADCNNCTCKNRKWICTKKECSRICTIYGDSHYISFDGRRYTFNGNCEYTLAQDYCSNSNKGTFRIITENIPCGTTGTTCSKAIKIYLGGKVCGLCGNYDGDWNNDFMTRGGEEVTQATEFGNSWKVSATCPEASNIHNPCDMRPYRQAWALKQCSILKSDVFRKCHTVVDPTQYYDACVRDTCACDAGGDCECFCTAVAAYASACSVQGVCILWRTPTICPLFCDYYNRNESCEWHYKPCGQSCMKTCRNPTGACYSEIPLLEGKAFRLNKPLATLRCFPQCPSDRPYLEEATNKCVAREECGCYDDETNTHHNVGDKIPTTKNCMKCYCTVQGPSCHYSQTDCYCEYNGQKYENGKIIYHTTDGDGACLTAICGQNGTIVRNLQLCQNETTPTTPVTVFNFTSSSNDYCNSTNNNRNNVSNNNTNNYSIYCNTTNHNRNRFYTNSGNISHDHRTTCSFNNNSNPICYSNYCNFPNYNRNSFYKYNGNINHDHRTTCSNNTTTTPVHYSNYCNPSNYNRNSFYNNNGNIKHDNKTTWSFNNNTPIHYTNYCNSTIHNFNNNRNNNNKPKCTNYNTICFKNHFYIDSGNIKHDHRTTCPNNNTNPGLYSNYCNSSDYNRNSFYNNSGNINHDHRTTSPNNNTTNPIHYSNYCNSTNYNRNSFYNNSGNINHDHRTTSPNNNTTNPIHYSNYCNSSDYNRNSFYNNTRNINHDHRTTSPNNTTNPIHYSNYCNSTNYNRNSFYNNPGNINHDHRTTCSFNNNPIHYSNYCNSTNYNRNSFYNNSGNINHDHRTTSPNNNTTNPIHYSNYCNSSDYNRNSFYNNTGNINHDHRTTSPNNTTNPIHYSNYCNSTNYNRNSFYNNPGNINHDHRTTCSFNNNPIHYSNYCNSTNYNRNSFYNDSGNINHDHRTTSPNNNTTNPIHYSNYCNSTNYIFNNNNNKPKCTNYNSICFNYCNSSDYNRNSFYSNSGNINHDHRTTCSFNNNTTNPIHYSNYCNSSNYNRNSFYNNSGNINHDHRTTSPNNTTNPIHHSNYCNSSDYNRNSFYNNSGNINHDHRTTCSFNNNTTNPIHYSNYCNSSNYNRNSFYNNSGNINHDHRTTSPNNTTNPIHYSNYCDSSDYNRNSFYNNSGNIKHDHRTTCPNNNTNPGLYSNYCNSSNYNRNSFYNNSGNINHDHRTTSPNNTTNPIHYSNYCNSSDYNRNSFYNNLGNINHDHRTTCSFNNNPIHYSNYCNSTNYNRNSFYNNSGNINHDHRTTSPNNNTTNPIHYSNYCNSTNYIFNNNNNKPKCTNYNSICFGNIKHDHRTTCPNNNTNPGLYSNYCNSSNYNRNSFYNNSGNINHDHRTTCSFNNNNPIQYSNYCNSSDYNRNCFYNNSGNINHDHRTTSLNNTTNPIHYINYCNSSDYNRNSFYSNSGNINHDHRTTSPNNTTNPIHYSNYCNSSNYNRNSFYNNSGNINHDHRTTSPNNNTTNPIPYSNYCNSSDYNRNSFYNNNGNINHDHRTTSRNNNTTNPIHYSNYCNSSDYNRNCFYNNSGNINHDHRITSLNNNTTNPIHYINYCNSSDYNRNSFYSNSGNINHDHRTTSPNNTTNPIHYRSVMYNQTDGTGWCFTAHCESGCSVVKKSGPCIIISTPTPYTSPQVSTITPTPAQKHCKFLDPPRKNGETWRKMCFEETCQDGSVISTPVQCLNSDLTVPVCENGIPPVKVYDKTGCCYHYECQCRCTGWGDPHYVSFDGTYYAFQGNCTYVLVQEIIKKYNFSVHIKNYMCDIEQALACPEYLTVYYKSYKIELRQTRNPTVNTVYVNNKKMTPVYTNADFTITTTGIAMTLDIPAIKAQVTFKGMFFLVSIPFSQFHNNTEGQCGNCDNNRSNDCKLPNGKVIKSCEEMAPKWRVNNTVCPITSPSTTKMPQITTRPNTTTGAQPCQQSAICKIIFSKAFEECHKDIDPENFYKACVYDVCHMRNATGCFSLEGYARMCAEESICVDWRDLTNGQCPHNCPKHKVYLPCGPKMEKSCNSGYNEKLINCESLVCRDHFREGCYCPNGTTLLDTTSDVCTEFCGCIGSDGKPKQPGDKWRSECKECTCSKNSMGPLCEPVQCPDPEPCTKAGYELEIVDCCPQCVCKPRLCPKDIKKCPVGFELVQNRTDNDCCITFYCEPKNVCVFSENVYLPGDKVPTGSCEVCVCGLTVNSSSNLLNTECTPMDCNTTCPMGFSYEDVPGKCCGNCVQKQCVYQDADQSNKITTAEVGQSWTHPSKPCVTFNCTKVNNVFVLVKIPPSCPEYNPQDCIPGTEQITSDGCCKTCQLHKCNLKKNTTYLEINDCTSIQPVEIASCSGSCDTKSIYSMAANTMMHHCTCCKELRTSSKKVQLRCANNTLKPYTYTYVEECGCHITNCTD
ncbi:hypothetical protein QTP70_022760 [Hemibagrus guttatus]|uniref:Uncharacterized protein n=1 Tax=Hemibagrus guttatus TaxID=175788 RepID=A0AAE0QNH0_9TELE|nr:hypothetical protein QTP70_022760 [Hemibagrus guttatus]